MRGGRDRHKTRHVGARCPQLSLLHKDTHLVPTGSTSVQSVHNPCTSALVMHAGVPEGHHLPHKKAGFCLHISKDRLAVPV